MRPTSPQAVSALLLAIVLCMAGCDILGPDGGADDLVGQDGGYFYLIDRGAAKLVMTDARLQTLKTWDLFGVLNDSSFQGITIDGKNLWLSFAGSADRIVQVDAGGDRLAILNAFDAPPAGRGTVRDIAWDGANLWALNSGSVTYALPPVLYKLNPADGAVLAEYPVPSPEPRGLTFVTGFSGAYGAGSETGLYYTDVTNDMVFVFRTERPQFDTAFQAPVPPRGQFSVYPVGLTNDGLFFWLVNSSGYADHLYKLSYAGKEEMRLDLPFAQPGPIVWSPVDIRIGTPPRLLAVSPSAGTQGTSLSVELFGEGFRQGAGLAADFGPGITVDSLVFVSQSRLHSRVTIDPAAPLGKRAVTVTFSGGLSSRLDTAFAVVAVPVLPAHLWLLEQDQDSLYRIRISDTTVVQRWDTRTVAPGGSPQGIGYDGSALWLCASGTDRTLYKLDTSGPSLSAVSSIPGPTPSGTLRGIVWDNGFFWVAVSGLSPAGRVYKVDPVTGGVVDSITTPGVEVRGVAVAFGKLYCNDTSIDSVFAFDFGTRTWSGAFAVPTPPDGGSKFSTGLTWDGANFWMANSSGASDLVWKLSPGGTVLDYFWSPRKSSSAQLTGIVFTPN